METDKEIFYKGLDYIGIFLSDKRSKGIKSSEFVDELWNELGDIGLSERERCQALDEYYKLEKFI